MKKLAGIFLLFIGLFISINAYSQTDVIVTLQINPPYSPYLSTYADQPNKLLVTLINQSAETYSLKLWVQITGDNGVSITTKADFNPTQAITLGPFENKPISFDSDETHDYFDVNHVSLVGITKSDLIQNQALPEGNYQICVHALDYEEPYTQRSVDFCAALPVFYIDPPLATQPTCGSEVMGSNPQFVLFSWTPPATAPGLIQYEFTLKQVPNNLNPNDVIKNNTFPTIFNTTQTANTVLPYTVSMPNLEEGKKYVWRVKVSDPANSVQFKNGGYSEACTFTYGNSITYKPNNFIFNNPIKLVSPANGSEIQWVTATGSEYGHYKFEWENPGITGVSFHTKLVKMNDGQTKEDAIAKNFDLNQTDKGEPMESPYKYFAKFEGGKKYAWQVVTNDWDQAKIRKSDIWEFTVPNSEEADFSTFTMCGYTINVSTFTNKDIDNLSGTGYLYLWQGSPKVIITFNGLTVRHCGLVNGKKTDWRVAKGFIGDQLKGFKPVELTPKDIEGEFELSLISFSLESSLNPYYDKDKGYYIIQEGDKGEGCKRKIWSSMVWHTPFTQAPVDDGKTLYFIYDQSYTASSGVDVDLGPQNLILTEPSTGINSAVLPFYGNMMFEKDIEIVPDHPGNCKLLIEKGSWFNVVGKEVSAYLKGKFSMWNGKNMWLGFGKSVKWYDEYSFSGATSLLLKLTPINGDIKMPWNKNGSVFSTLGNQQAWAVLGDQSVGGVNQKGLVYPDIRVDIKFPNNTTGFCSFKNLINNGTGFYIMKYGEISGDAKFNAFKSTMKDVRIKIAQSKLLELTVNGDMEIPFINGKAPFTFYADYDGVQPGYIDLAYLTTNETTVFEKGADKITCLPTSATVTYDKVTLDADFNFYNNLGKNVKAKGVPMREIVISPNGDVKMKSLFSGILLYQTNAKFNQFPFKLKGATVKGTGADKHYTFYLGGQLTLEESTIASSKDFNTALSFYQPENPDWPYYNEANLTACADGGNEPVAALSPTDNSLDVTSSSVCAEVSPNGLGSFDGCFKFFDENTAPYGPVYGSGFMLVVDADFEEPMKKSLHTKIMVGKKTGFRYWFVEAEQQGFAEVPTGILDISIYGFGGRIYYHMSHEEGGNINNSDYVPDGYTGFGLYGNALVKTAGSEGRVMWGNLSTEIQTTESWGLKTATQRGEVEILSSGAGEYDGKIKAVADFTIHFQTPKYLEGYVTVKGNVYDLLELNNGTAYVKFADNDWHLYAGTKATPINVNIIPIGKELNGYFTIQRINGQVNLGAGVSGELYGMHVGDCMCLVGAFGKCGCSGCYHADVGLSGSVDATATFPKLQLGGSFTLTGSAGVDASICGVGLDPSISATFKGAFTMPSPFCLAGGIAFHTPWPFPDFSINARWKDGSFDQKNNCD